MARPRKTGEEDPVESAMGLFWQHGFNQTGTRLIEDETGLTRFLLQREYGGKRALFLKALDRYLDVLESELSPPDRPASPDALANWFFTVDAPEDLIHFASNGCFLLASLMEGSSEQLDLQPRADRFFRLMRSRLAGAIEHLKGTGQIRADVDAPMAGEILLGMAVSKSVQIRASRDIDAARPIGRAVKDLLEQWAI